VRLHCERCSGFTAGSQRVATPKKATREERSTRRDFEKATFYPRLRRSAVMTGRGKEEITVFPRGTLKTRHSFITVLSGYYRVLRG